eukprot:g21082.t1
MKSRCVHVPASIQHSFHSLCPMGLGPCWLRRGARPVLAPSWGSVRAGSAVGLSSCWLRRGAQLVLAPPWGSARACSAMGLGPCRLP